MVFSCFIWLALPSSSLFAPWELVSISYQIYESARDEVFVQIHTKILLCLLGIFGSNKTSNRIQVKRGEQWALRSQTHKHTYYLGRAEVGLQNIYDSLLRCSQAARA